MRRRCPRARRWFASIAGALAGTAVLVLAAAPAAAHVTVHPSTLPAGAKDVEMTFRVPNERDDANTVALQVYFPTTLPLLTVDVAPVPGWSAGVHTTHLATPVTTDDGEVDQIVSDVTWRATAGGIAPGQYVDFPVAAGAVPDRPGSLVFKALQTYSSGEIVRWIEVPVSGQPEPDNPAPVLTLEPASTPSGPTSPATAIGVAVAALVVALVALGAFLALGVRSRRAS
ncbi:MAG TPA: YcnI family protein [Acidimicrobiales bacterium]|nr:YcnI family protein [Acidimicrobiales bacterium]